MAADNGYEPTRSPTPVRWDWTGIESAGLYSTKAGSSARASVTATIFLVGGQP